MDSRDFEEFIKQHVQIKKDQRKNRRQPRPEDDEGPIEITRGDKTIVITEQHNPTIPIDNFTVVKQPQPCDDCERVVQDRRVEIKQYDFPFKHWRRRCLACCRFYNPETEQFDLNNMAAVNFWNRQHKESKSEPVLKKPTK